jgi:radical SAM protein with 4Fe4S-binding SPASM domain
MFQFSNQLVLKVTKGCNLRCDYCYVLGKDDFEGKFIDFELFKLVIDRIVVDRLKSTTGENQDFNIVFHGGEPTTLSRRQFYQMCEYAQERFLRNKLRLKFSVQTNLTLVDEEWCKLFNKFQIHVGASWDGIGSANKNRTSKTDKFYLDKIKMMSKYGVNFGFLLVVTHQSVDAIAKSIKYMKANFGVSNARLNYVEDVINPVGVESPVEVSGKEFLQKVIEPQVEQYIKNGSCFDVNTSHVINRFMLDYLTNVGSYYPENGNCYIKYCGSGINVIEMDPDGTLLFCGRYGEAYEKAVMMHSLESDFLSLKQITKHVAFQKAKIEAMKKSHCDSCLAQNICDHGCMAYHYTKPQADGSHEWGIRNDLTCTIFKPLYSHLLANAQRLFDSYLKNVVVPQGSARLSFPNNDGGINLYLNHEPIQPLLQKYDFSIGADSSGVIFTKNGVQSPA